MHLSAQNSWLLTVAIHKSTLCLLRLRSFLHHLHVFDTLRRIDELYNLVHFLALLIHIQHEHKLQQHFFAAFYGQVMIRPGRRSLLCLVNDDLLDLYAPCL